MKENYVIKHSEKDEYIALDEASGGYPYITSRLSFSRIWDDFADLERYWKMFSHIYPGFEFHKIHISRLNS